MGGRAQESVAICSCLQMTPSLVFSLLEVLGTMRDESRPVTYCSSCGPIRCRNNASLLEPHWELCSQRLVRVWFQKIIKNAELDPGWT